MVFENNIDKIDLPLTEEVFKKMSTAKRFAMDIGGSLIKIAYSSTYECKAASFSEKNDANAIYSLNEENKQVPALNFIKFETKYIEMALDYMQKNLKEFNEGRSIKVTGGGAYKYKELITQKLGVHVEKEDEMQCLIKGCNFLIKNIPNEVFSIDYNDLKYEFKKIENDHVFPYLLVNIGSGVSIVKVESDTEYQRVGGSTIGGATLWGLGSLLTDAQGFDELLELAEKGDNRSVDMLVKDIYGCGYETLGLQEDLIASSMGKATRSVLDHHIDKAELQKKFKQEDIVKSILLMICYDVSQIASLYAQIHKVNKVFFGGYFIHGSEITMKFLKHGICFWSQNKIDCLFLRHEGYLGSIGAFLKSISVDELNQSKYSWYENYARSSGFVSQRHRSDSASLYDCLELNQEDNKLVACPLLMDPANYVPDLFDLTKDEEARNYWLECFEKTIHTYEKQCIKSQIKENTSEARANQFKNSYLIKLSHLKESPFSYGMLTVRSLLDLREHCMSEFKFVDVYSNEKHEENRMGLDLLPGRLKCLDEIKDEDEHWFHLFKGLLAGNVYDYGAQAFIQKHDKGELNQFNMALESIDDNIWKDSDFLAILTKLKKRAFKCVAMFIDNSGFDIILGVLPLVIELLKNEETKVIMCANSKPAINDITYGELLILIKKACIENPVLDRAFNVTKSLLIIQTGSGSPCLDLSRINYQLAESFIENKVDLIILEGMGRALHTNYSSKFKCDCLKAAVIKNQWLANRFNFKNTKDNKFPVIFKYEPASIA